MSSRGLITYENKDDGTSILHQTRKIGRFTVRKKNKFNKHLNSKTARSKSNLMGSERDKKRAFVMSITKPRHKNKTQKKTPERKVRFNTTKKILRIPEDEAEHQDDMQ